MAPGWVMPMAYGSPETVEIWTPEPIMPTGPMCAFVAIATGTPLTSMKEEGEAAKNAILIDNQSKVNWIYQDIKYFNFLL